VDKVLKFINDNYSFDLTKTQKLKLSDGKALKEDKILEDLQRIDNLKAYDLIAELASDFNFRKAISDSLESIRLELVANKYQKEVEGVPEEFLPHNVIVGVDKYDNDTYILNKDYEVLDVSADSWRTVFGHKAFVEIPKSFCKLVYDPYNTKKVLNASSSVKVINTCYFPQWRYRNPSEDLALNPLFLKFFEGLFSNRESLEYVCSWYLNALFQRNETALVMVGAKAVGKNIFCSTFNRMVGDTNVSNQANNAYTEKFNGFLKNTRIVVADEVSFKDGSEKNRVKKYFNKMQSIEEKGKDARTIEVFASMVMLSNDVRDLYIEADDRRFSCIDLTDATLPSRMSQDEILQLKEYIDNDEDFPLAFCQYLKRNQAKVFTNALPFKGKIYDKLVLSSLSGVKLAILNRIVDGVADSFTLSEIDFDWEKEYPRRKPSFYYFEEFMTNFRYEGKKLGQIVTARKTLEYTIVPNPDLMVSGFGSKL
jgi:hypothetical protein